MRTLYTMPRKRGPAYEAATGVKDEIGETRMDGQKQEEKRFEKSRCHRVLRSTARGVGRVGLWLLLAVLAYAIVGTLLSLVPVNGQPPPGGDVVVYLRTNGAHTDIVVPTQTGRIDWSKVAPPDDTASKIQWDYLAIGWGAQDFYLNVKEWKDLTFDVALRAISGMGGTALHTVYVAEPSEDVDCRRLTLSAAQYDKLVKYILESGKQDAAGAFVRIPHEGYSANDAFYEGVGRYSPFFTCNTWANSALKACGQKCCLWTALSPPIFWNYPLEAR